MNKYYFFLVLTLLTSCSTFVRKMVTKSAYQPYNQEMIFPFEWAKDSIAGQFYEKAALLIPVKLNNIEHPFLMQFDLGSPSTVLYGKTLQALKAQYPQNKIQINQQKKRHFAENIELNLNAKQIQLKPKMLILPNMGDTILQKANTIIGTLGYDFIKGKIMTIDYPNQTILLSDTLASTTNQQVSYLKASTRYFPVIVTVTVDNKDRKMMFDTGSSAFDIITTHKKFKQVEAAEKNLTDSLCCVQAWGKKYRLFSKKLKQPILIGMDTLRDQTLFTTERETFKADIGFAMIGIYGITGNSLVWNKKIIIDTKNNHFMVIKN